MKKVIQPVKGTRDFYPEQMAMRTWLYNTFRQVSESFGYQEYEGPILETLELYGAKSGEELVQDQAYVFEDRSGSKIALRPELTPSLARMVAQKQNDLNFPVRWWSFGPFWRYERPQKGRTREFFQWNVDLVGVDSPEADAENVAVLATFFQRVGLTPSQVMIRVNDRRLMEERFEEFAIAKEKRSAVFGWIDRREKLPMQDWLSMGTRIGLTSTQLERVQSMLGDLKMWRRSDKLERFFAAIGAMGLSSLVVFDPTVVRGLLYYTGTVFEAWEEGGDIRRSILGGGRYDNLLTDVGGTPLPAVGFAMGDVVISLILDKYKLLPNLTQINPADVLVSVFDKDRFSTSIEVAAELRASGMKVICYPEAIRLDKQLRYADRMNIPYVILCGPSEMQSGTVTVKFLKTGEQKTIARRALSQEMHRFLATG